ncbi:NAD+ synthase [Nostoc sp. CHAB 5834]|nr:NAD+ synthase [Nostoc sp. CHAB 5834]
MLKITTAQINPTIGDFEGNLALMSKAAAQSLKEGAAMVVFPELSLTGYYPGDLLESAHFASRLAKAVSALRDATLETPGLYWVVGLPTPYAGNGKKWRNSLVVLRNGDEVLTYHKQLLPTYNVFDERRHFEPGPDRCAVLNVEGTQVGFIICEDGWNNKGDAYAINPFDRLADARPDLVVSINASPSNVHKRAQRHEVFLDACKSHGLPLLYVNQVGGQDQLVFDGASFAVGTSPEFGFQVQYEANRFEEAVDTLTFKDGQFLSDVGTALAPVPPEGLPVSEFYRQQIVLGLKDYARRCGFRKAVIGSSGGIDSALTMALAVEALGPENVVGITMPSEYSSEGSVSDSVALCNNLGIELLEHPIRAQVESFKAQFERTTGTPLQGLPLENLQARIRGTILMEYSNAFGHLLLTTGNKSEISVGYCTLYGDTNGGLGLIGDLYKTEVFELCRHLNASAGREVIPVAIIDKPPSAELAPGQKDTDSLPPYEVLDEVLKYYIEGTSLTDSPAHVVSRLDSTLVERILGLIARSEYKRRQAPPILRVRARAFGSGRQVPIAAKHF